MNSLVFDYVVRQKVGGTHLTFFSVKQLPVLPPDIYSDELLGLIAPRVLELTYTAHDMAPFARDLGYDGPPFVWDEERRSLLRAELDGIYAHLYGISREDFAYILDTFPIVARKDIAQYGEYRTKRLCLEAYDHFSPATLRALNEEVHEIEQALRRLIVSALGNDADALPADLRNRVMAEWVKHRTDRSLDNRPPLRSLLESSYLSDLDKIIRSEVVWSQVGDRFESKQKFGSHLGRLNNVRNPLVHGRSMDEVVRENGEEAVTWFRERVSGGTRVG
ncbi:MAG: hypothetical protein IT335_03375 [Thermomicrobiales bacterium]|nr:hypothetical protein [Thermomicrobiales bacterium]